MPANKIITVQTPPQNAGIYASAEFDKSRIDDKVWSKGYDVHWEKAVQCPCKAKGHNHLSTCKNCGSTGWIFLNKHQTRMLLYSMSVNRKFEVWTMQDQGTIHITALDVNKLTYMDRVTVLDGLSVHNQILYTEEKGSDIIARTVYEIEEIEYIAAYVNATTPLTRIPEEEYTISKNFLTFDPIHNNKQITIRYKHRPQFHVVDILRETMSSRTKKNTVRDEQFPIHAIGRRSHFVHDTENYTNDRIIDNSFNVC